MKKVSDAIKGLEVDFMISEKDQAILASAVKQEAFDILQTLLEDQVRKFNVALINTDVTNEKGILANFYRAKAVSQFYAGFIERLQDVLQTEAYNNAGIGTKENPEQSMQIEELA